jgi:hypothetical protein
MLHRLLSRNVSLVLVALVISCGANSQLAPVATATSIQVSPGLAATRPMFSTLQAISPTITSSPAVTETLTAATRIYIPTVTKPIKGFFVSPKGTSRGDGSMGKPWDLQTALNQPAKVHPGDTIWLRDGTYGAGNDSNFNSKLVGAVGNPITVRAYPGERSIIDGTITVYGSWSIFWGLELADSKAQRISQQAGSSPDDIHLGIGFIVVGPNNKFINNIVHDKRNGFGFWKQAVDSELYGNLSYNNGWQGPDRGHGYGIYTQNESGTKWIQDNIVFNNFGEYTLHIYGEQVYLRGFEIDGNVLFNGKMVLGGLLPASGIAFTNNYLYKINAKFGYRNQSNLDLRFSNNYLWSDEASALEIRWWQDLTVTGNFIQNELGRLVNFDYPNGSNTTRWNQNDFYAARDDSFYVNDQLKTWSAWCSQTGVDVSSSFKIGKPFGVDVFVRPNKYEAKRGHIIIYNWDLLDAVTVDISNLGLKIGDRFVLHNAQNYIAETIAGTYNGKPIRIPMNGWSIVTPVGWNQPLQPATFPRFGVFILTEANR